MHLEERFCDWKLIYFIWWKTSCDESAIIPLGTGRAGGCVKPWEHQSPISNSERTNPAWGWSCCASLCRSFWIMNYLQSHFKPHSHMEVRYRAFLRTKKVVRARWNAELDGKGKGRQEMWWELSIPCERGLALKDAGIIANKSGNFMLVPLNNERKCTLPKNGVYVEFCKDRSLWELTN